MFFRRRIALLGVIFLAARLQARSQETCSAVTYDVTGSAALYFRCMVIGEIVGAQFAKNPNRFFLYATQAANGNDSTIWADEIVQLALASLTVGPNYGFSLDFERNGTSEFKPEDIGDLVRFKKVLNSPHPIRQLLQEKIDSLLRKIATQSLDPRTDRQIKQMIAGALNKALDQDLAALISPEDVIVSPEVRELILQDRTSRRIRRLILEDVLAPEINRDVKS